MREVLRVPFLEFKADDSVKGRFSGYGSTFGNVDLGNDVCEKGCFKKSLDSLLSAGSTPGLFWQHNPNEPIGEWTGVSEDAKGLKVEGQLWVGDGIPKAEQAYKMLKSTGPKGLSIGFNTVQATSGAKNVRKIIEANLKEISIVTFPMNTKAGITSVKNVDGSVISKRELEDILRDAGMSAREAKSLIAGGYDALIDDPSRDAKAVEELKAAIIKNIQTLSA